jgi:hypothetical protein
MIKKILKGAYSYSKMLIMLLGVFLLVSLQVCGIAHSKIAIVVGDEVVGDGNLTRLTLGYMPYVLSIVMIVFVIGTIIEIIWDIKKGIKEVVKEDKRPILHRLFTWIVSFFLS